MFVVGFLINKCQLQVTTNEIKHTRYYSHRFYNVLIIILLIKPIPNQPSYLAFLSNFRVCSFFLRMNGSLLETTMSLPDAYAGMAVDAETKNNNEQLKYWLFDEFNDDFQRHFTRWLSAWSVVVTCLDIVASRVLTVGNSMIGWSLTAIIPTTS